PSGSATSKTAKTPSQPIYRCYPTPSYDSTGSTANKPATEPPNTTSTTRAASNFTPGSPRHRRTAANTLGRGSHDQPHASDTRSPFPGDVARTPITAGQPANDRRVTSHHAPALDLHP